MRWWVWNRRCINPTIFISTTTKLAANLSKARRDYSLHVCTPTSVLHQGLRSVMVSVSVGLSVAESSGVQGDNPLVVSLRQPVHLRRLTQAVDVVATQADLWQRDERYN